MIKLPEVNGTNWRKVLRELDTATYPSLPDFLQKIRGKLLKKEELLFSETQLGRARLKKYFEDFGSEINSLYINNIDFSGFARAPLPHQREAVIFLLKNNRCILGDDMGLGKSSSTLYAALLMESHLKVLVVTLKTLKYNFAKEVDILKSSRYIVEKKWEPGDAKFVICHYNQLKKFGPKIIEEAFDIVIIDEAHYIRNPKTQRTKIIMDVFKQTNPIKIWLLSGTPIDNRPSDYYNLLKIIKHPVAKNWQTYVLRYCDAYQDNWGRWNTGGASNLEELHNLTKDVFLRRLKNVIKGMTTKTREPIFIELKNKKGYDKVIEDFRKGRHQELVDDLGYKGSVDDVEVETVTRMMLHRQFCALEKIKDGTLVDMISDMLDSDETNKILVFTNFTSVIDTVQEHFGTEICSSLDGRILNPKKRLDIVDEFNTNPKKRVFVINEAVGSTGLNIQSANIVIVNDMAWVPSTMLQCEDRAYRIGQKRDVKCYYLIYDKTVEEVLYNSIEKKMQIISTVVEGNSEAYFNDENILNDDQKARKMEIERKDLIADIMKQMGF